MYHLKDSSTHIFSYMQIFLARGLSTARFLSKSSATGLQVPYSVFSIFSYNASITPASSTSSTVSLSLTLALHRFFTYFSMSKAFLSSKSDRSRYCLCLVKSNLLKKNGLPPKLHDALTPIHDCNLILAHKLFATLSSEEFILLAFPYTESCRCPINVLN